LRQLPVDSLNIDQAFVAQLDQDRKVVPIVRATVGLAHALELIVTAEGIETPDQLDALVEMGCDEGQGYLFSRPLPLEALMDFLEAHEAAQGAVA
jgi:EAL domain-containing protein (putative c-di-GMP-specific phosphodiesterase class I)